MTTSFNMSGAQDEVVEIAQETAELTTKKGSGAVQKMLQAGVLSIAALMAPQGVQSGEPNGTKFVSSSKVAVDEDPYLTDQLDVGYHVSNLSSHPKYREFSIKNAEYIRALAKTEEKHKFAAIIMIQFGEYLHAELTDEEKKVDEIYRYYYGSKIYPQDAGTDGKSPYTYNAYIMPQNDDAIVVAYGFHKETGRLVDTEVVAINPRETSVSIAIGRFTDHKEFRSKLAALNSDKVASTK